MHINILIRKLFVVLNEQPSYKRGVAGPIPDVIYSNHAGSEPSTGPRSCFIYTIHTIHTD